MSSGMRLGVSCGRARATLIRDGIPVVVQSAGFGNPDIAILTLGEVPSGQLLLCGFQCLLGGHAGDERCR